MAVISFKRIHQGRACRISVDSKGGSVIAFTDVYRAITDGNYTEPEHVHTYSSCPRVGSSHDANPLAFCRSVNVQNDAKSKIIYLVTCQYSTAYEMTEDPLAEPAKIRWNTVRDQVPVVKDRNGRAHLNAAGDEFDPPEMMNISELVATVRKNLPAAPTWMFQYRDAVNNAAFTLDGVTIAKGWAQIAGIEIGDWELRNDVPFRVVTLTIEFKEMESTTGMLKWNNSTESYDALGASEFEHAHAAITLNAGLDQVELTLKVPCLDDNGNEASHPMLLDALGAQVSNPAKPSDAKYVVSDTCKEKDFSALPLV